MTAPGRRAPAFAGAVPALDAVECINDRYNPAGCDRCAVICPTFAIDLDAITPIVDETACVVCGACVAACPTEAWSAGPGIQRLAATAQSLRGPIGVACSLDHSDNAGTVVEVDHCLAVLDVEAMLDLSLDGRRDVELHVSACADCPIGRLRSVVESSAALSDAVLSEAGHLGSIEVVDVSRSVDGGGARLKAGDLSRRGLLGLARSGAHVDARPRTPQSIPPRRRRLIERLAGWERLPSPVHQLFGTVAVDPASCSLCRLCAEFCPTGALAVNVAERTVTLSLQPAACIECGVCVAACPDDAVRAGPPPEMSAVARLERRDLVGDVVVECDLCRLPTRRRPGDAVPRCYSCRHGQGPVDALRDGAGLMDDLLARIARMEDGRNNDERSI